MAGQKLIINKDHSSVTTTVNTLNEYSTVFKMVVPASRIYALHDGAPIRMKLKDVGVANLPDTTSVRVYWRKPSGRELQFIDEFELRPFNSLTDSDQMDLNKRRAVAVAVGNIGLRQDFEMVIQIKSSVAIVWANSYLELEVEELGIGF